MLKKQRSKISVAQHKDHVVLDVVLNEYPQLYRVKHILLNLII